MTEKEWLEQMTSEKIDAEYRGCEEKARYWLQKQIDKSCEYSEYWLFRKMLTDNVKHIASPLYLYDSKSMRIAVIMSAHRRSSYMVSVKDLIMIYGEGNDLGVAMKSGDGEETEHYIVFTSGFLASMEESPEADRMETIRQFYANNESYHECIWKDDDGGEYPVLVFDGFIGIGKKEEDGRVIVTERMPYAMEYDNATESVKTHIITDRATESQRRQIGSDVERHLKNVAQRYEDVRQEKTELMGVEYRLKYVPVEYAIFLFEDAKKGLMKKYYINKQAKALWISVALVTTDLILDIAQGEVPLPILGRQGTYHQFYTKCIQRAYDKYVQYTGDDKNGNMRQEIAEAATKILWHKQYDCELEDVLKALDNLPQWQEWKKKTDSKYNSTMDKTTKEQLRRVLKAHGLRDKYENLVRGQRTTVEAWYNHIEALYAIRRLIPYRESEKDEKKLTEADKAWVGWIVDNNKCALLTPYCDKHGKEVVKQAISYLMDNYLWESPQGIEGIKKADPAAYKGLTAIEEAVEYLKSEGKLEPEEQPEEEREMLPKAEEEPEIRTGKMTDAKRCFADVQELFGKLQANMAALESYVKDDELTDMLEQENTKLTKEVKRLTESIKVVNQQYGDCKKDLEKQKQTAYEAMKKANEEALKFDKLKAQYDEMKANYDFLKREAQKVTEELPRVKVIPVSKLQDLPLIGKAVLKSLIPFLKQHGIEVDERR